jgi:hypothetical protein
MSIIESPIASSAAWLGSEIRDPVAWSYRLSAAQVAEIGAAVRSAKRAGKSFADLTIRDFPLPTLAAEIRQWATAIDRGRGFILVRGFPTNALGHEDAALAYYGLGLHLGMPVTQNVKGDVICHVKDHGIPPTGPDVRRYMTREEQGFHTDGADVIGLLCLRRAKAGGLSRIVSSASVYNELLRLRPDLVPLLYEPWSFLGEFRFELPICSIHEGRLRTFYIGWYIRDAQARPEVPRLSPAQNELLELIESTANDPRFYLDMDFEEGDIQLLSNATILHACTAYEDHAEPERRRHLLRLWLSPHDFSSVEPLLARGVPEGGTVA